MENKDFFRITKN